MNILQNKLKEKKLGFYNGRINLQNVLNEHVSKSKARKALKTIFPPSMYEKYV